MWPLGSSPCFGRPQGRPSGDCCRSCWLCRPPPKVHWADLPLLGLGLLRQQDERQQAPQVCGLGHLDQLCQLGRLGLAGGLFIGGRLGLCRTLDVLLLDGGRVDRTLDVVLLAGGCVLSLESSSANLLMTSQGMALLSPEPAQYIYVRLPVGLSPKPFSLTRLGSFRSLS
jgi:hypothetical protein